MNTNQCVVRSLDGEGWSLSVQRVTLVPSGHSANLGILPFCATSHERTAFTLTLPSLAGESFWLAIIAEERLKVVVEPAGEGRMNVTQIVLASGSKLIRAQPASPDGGIRFIGVDTGDQEPPPLLRILDGPALAARIGIRLLSPVAFENYTGAALDLIGGTPSVYEGWLLPGKQAD